MKEIKENFYEEKEITLRDILNIFLRRKGFFSSVSIILFIAIILFQFLKPYTPIYLVTFDIGISEEKPMEAFFSPVSETPTIQIGTVTQRIISNLLSTRLAEKVVDSLSLYAHVKNGARDIKVQAKILYDFKDPIGPLKIKINGEKIEIYDENGRKIKEGIIKEYINLGVLKFKIIPLEKSEEKKLQKEFKLTFYPRRKIALSLRNSLSIKVLEADKIEKEGGFGGVPFSGEAASKKLVTAKTIFPGLNLIGILRINVYWGNPEDALKIAQVLSEQIIKEDIREKSLQFIQSRKFIESQLAFYQQKLTELEEKIKNFKEKKKIADLRASTQSLISQVSQLESRKNQLEIEQEILNDLGEYLVSGHAGDTTLNFAVALLSDPVLQNFYSQLLQVEARLKGLLKEYSSSHPKVLEIKAQLEGLKEQMKEEITKRMSSIKTEIQSVKNQVVLLQAKLENVPQDEVHLARLERDKETAEKLYTFFAEKLEETRVKEAGVTSDLKIINPPIVSPKPVNAKRPFLIVLLAFIISILVGGFAIFIAEYIDNTVKDPDLVKARIGLPVFGSIPLADREKKKITDLIRREKLSEELKIFSSDSSSGEFEAFRKLSINLEFAHPEKKYRVIYVTSAGPEEGKTFVTLNLSAVLSQVGKKVIVVDTDFRKKKGHLTDITKLKKEEGIFDILKGEIDLKSAIITLPLFPAISTNATTPKNPKNAINPENPSRPFKKNKINETNEKNEKNEINEINEKNERNEINETNEIHAIPIGDIPPNPFIFLQSEKMKELIQTLKKEYDYVIIDGVPVLLFADAAYLATYTDGVLLTARYGKTNFKELEDAKEILLTSRAEIIGIVMNAVPKKRGSYYYYYHYRYYQKYYGKK